MQFWMYILKASMGKDYFIFHKLKKICEYQMCIQQIYIFKRNEHFWKIGLNEIFVAVRDFVDITVSWLGCSQFTSLLIFPINKKF